MDLALAHAVAPSSGAPGTRSTRGRCGASGTARARRRSVSSAPVRRRANRSSSSARLQADRRLAPERAHTRGSGTASRRRLLPALRSRRASGIGVRGGMRELGLPYEADPAITRHIAYFLARHLPAGRLPTAVLMNGGVMKSPALAERVMAVLAGWAAAACGSSRARISISRWRGGRRITGSRGAGAGSASAAARRAPITSDRIGDARRARHAGAAEGGVCRTFGMEEGSEAALPGREFGLVVGEPVTFRLLASSVRGDDRIGTVVESWSRTISRSSSRWCDAAGRRGAAPGGATVPCGSSRASPRSAPSRSGA